MTIKERIEPLITELQKIVDEINSTSKKYKLEVKQQKKKKVNISIVGANGRLGTGLQEKGYTVSLQGHSIEERMYGFLKELFGREHDRYAQTQPEPHYPLWKTENFDDVKEAIYYYAEYTPTETSQDVNKNTNEDLDSVVYPDEMGKSNETHFEGGKTTRLVNAYERNPIARKKCIEHYGVTCVVCGFNFEKVYGNIGKDFIEVHHLSKVSDKKQEYEVNPVEDLRPVCPNCHAMLHKKDPPYTIDELKILIKR
jgi:predicted HNH restriction endonuclease